MNEMEKQDLISYREGVLINLLEELEKFEKMQVFKSKSKKMMIADI